MSIQHPGQTRAIADEGSCLLPPKDRRRSSVSTLTPPDSILGNVWLLLRCSWTNVLIVSIPIAIHVAYFQQRPTTLLDTTPYILPLNFVAILAVTGLFRFASESLYMAMQSRARQVWTCTIGSLSLDTLVVLIALYQDRLELIKAYVVGKVITTLLLNLGTSFLVSGMLRPHSSFSPDSARALTLMLATAFLPFTLIAVFPLAIDTTSTNRTLVLSRGTSIVLLMIHIAYQIFRNTHTAQATNELTPLTPSTLYSSDEITLVPDQSHQTQHIHPLFAVPTMILTGLLTYTCTLPILHMLKSHPPSTLTPSAVFFGTFLLPLLPECATLPQTIRLAIRNQVDTTFERASESCVQTLFSTAPLLVLLAWTLDKSMDLSLDGIQVISLAMAIWVFNSVIRKGSGDYLIGVVLLGLYIMEVLSMYLAHWDQ